MNKLKVGLFFGGRSTEHEVSILTALQAFENLDKQKYEIIPVFISKLGDFYTNPKFLDIKNFKDEDSLLMFSTKINFTTHGLQLNGFFPKQILLDVALLSFHGSFGEDGAIQGLLEMYKIPYTGFNVTGSAVAMDKVISKALFGHLNLPVCEYVEVKRFEWIKDPKKCLKQVQDSLKFPMFVKPATIGSSIGVNKADNASLEFALEVAFTYSEKVLVEEALEGKLEVNCSALGYEEIQASVCESPIASQEILSFADKYQKGGKMSKAGLASLSRIIPAPISADLTEKIQQATIKIFKALDGCGVARIDYFVDKENGKFWVNEINSPPGSFAFYLWEKSAIKFKQLLDMLIEFALKRAQNQNKTQYTFASNLLSDMAKSAK